MTEKEINEITENVKKKHNDPSIAFCYDCVRDTIILAQEKERAKWKKKYDMLRGKYDNVVFELDSLEDER